MMFAVGVIRSQVKWSTRGGQRRQALALTTNIRSRLRCVLVKYNTSVLLTSVSYTKVNFIVWGIDVMKVSS